MRWSGPDPAALHRLPPAPPHHGHTCIPSFVHGDVYHNFVTGFQVGPGCRPSTSWPCWPSGCTSTTASGACCRRSASATRATTGCGTPSPPLVTARGRGRQHLDPGRGAGRLRGGGAARGGGSALADGAERSNVPDGPLEKKWDKHRFEMKLVNPANKRKYNVIVVGTGLAGAVGRRLPGRAGLQRRWLLLPGQPAARPLHRRPGRHQRRQELPERRRQRLPPVLRHREGRRLPRARGQRLPPGRRSA